MLYQITDGTVSLGGEIVLSHVDFEIKGNEKIAVVGRNGAGKTTLLKLIAGELELDRDDRRQGPGIYVSRKLSVGMLRQQAGSEEREKTVEELLLAACPGEGAFSHERYEYEKEYDTLFTGFGFAKTDKSRRLGEFSGGQQTRILMIQLLLQKPDILLLDEPTNHLDLESVEWLEQYIRRYGHAVVMVSHDRFFLDQTADMVYELSGKRLSRYPGNYTFYRREKIRRISRQQSAYEQQQAEIRRLEELIERFRNKPAKAAFARSRKKILERTVPVQKPETDDVHLFTGPITPLETGSKLVLQAEHLKVGYDAPLLEIGLCIRRGQKLGISGPNGSGKTTLLKTVAGRLAPLSGSLRLGSHITVGYFDQHSAEIRSDKTVIEHFHEHFPALTEKEARQILGAFLFGGKAAAAKVSDLSGGEKARLVLAELLQSRPNFLVLDEPTNHMDIQAKETLESALMAYKGTILFVSHDRYFLDRVADCMLIFGDEGVAYYPFGYSHYLERLRKRAPGTAIPAQVAAEDEALIAGIRSVPKAERHRIRELPEEEEYADWRMRLAGEALEAAKSRAEESFERMIYAREKLSEAYFASANAAAYDASAGEIVPADAASANVATPDAATADNAGVGAAAANAASADDRYAQDWEAWHAACLEWYDAFLETERP